jgi:predicted  nucleic acid-binding Zn-ribbon protein
MLMTKNYSVQEMPSTPAEDEAFKELEAQVLTLDSTNDTQKVKKPRKTLRHSADIQTEYNIYSKAVADLQQQHDKLRQEFTELEATYKIICRHSVKLEKCLAQTKKDLATCQRSWLKALLFRLRFIK